MKMTATSVLLVLVLMVGMVTSAVHCPDGTQCQDQNTCCPTTKGYACCPYPSAVCCLDKTHCCPQDYSCDFQTKTCVKEGRHWHRFALSPQMPAHKTKEISVWPQDKCCLSETDCCPFGYHCNEWSGACTRDTDHITSVVHVTAASDSQVQAGIIRCSSRFYCPAGNTCCKTTSGTWGCCPYPLGQCCKDGKHCCEYGYDCDPTFSTCKGKSFLSIPARLKTKALLL